MRVSKPIVMLLLFIFSASVSFAIDDIIPGVIQHHGPDEEILWDWYTYVPETLSKSELGYILITAPGVNSDYEATKELVYNEMQTKLGRGNPLKLVQLGIAMTHRDDPYISTGALHDYECWFDSTPELFKNPNLKINKIIDKLLYTLGQDGWNIHSKVLIEGFSTGGSFAYNYCLLHPERIQAISAGGCGFLGIPSSSYEEMVLDWPLGVNDLPTLIGIDFDFDAFMQVPKYIYVGENDTNFFNDPSNSVEILHDFQKIFLDNTFGNLAPVRLKNQTDKLVELGGTVKFKMYSNVGHEYTEEMKDDAFAFLAQYIEKQNSGSGGGSGGRGSSCFIKTTNP